MLPAIISNHPYVAGFAVCWLLSCFAESLPKPRPVDSPFYVFLFQFLHSLAGAIPRMIALTFPPKYAQLFNSSMQPPDAQTDPQSLEPKPAPDPEHKERQ